MASVNPPAELEARPGDVDVPLHLLVKLAPFTQLRQAPLAFLEKVPGACKLRFFKVGDKVCQHGEPGWSAFCFVPAAEIAALRDHAVICLRDGPKARDDAANVLARLEAEGATEVQLNNQRKALAKLDEELTKLPEVLARFSPWLATRPPAAGTPQQVAVAKLPRLRPQRVPRRGWLQRLRRLLTGDQPSAEAYPAVIRGDGPRDFDFKSRQMPLVEGELVGEISCRYRTPRSATVTVTHDCFVVEFMRNILTKLLDDELYKQRMVATEKKRLLNSALREITLLADLPEPELQEIADQMEFKEYQPGSLVFDEHEEPDGLYVIGNGIVKVVANVSWLLAAGGPLDAGSLRKELAHPNASHDKARKIVADSLATVGDKDTIRALNRILTDPAWWTAPTLREVVQAEGLALEVWRKLAVEKHSDARGLVLGNCLLLQLLDAPPQTALKPEVMTEPLTPAVVADWKKLCARLVPDPKKTDDLAQLTRQSLPPAAQAILDKGAKAALSDEDQKVVIAALNAILGEELLLLTPSGCKVACDNDKVAKRLLPFLRDGQLWGDYDFHRWNRCLNRLLLDKLCPTLAALPHPSGLPIIRTYLSRNNIFGEVGMLLTPGRTATLVTYNHPKHDPDRSVGPVHLFKIGLAVFENLLRRPELRGKMEAKGQHHLETDRQPPPPTGRVDRALIQSPRGEQLGLIEGQKLMLIDLDRCTRCDECVRACVATHDDGRSRLFLVGERQGNFLVPATCRLCLDPVCMIGCPVSSIHPGDDKQIVIRDWCIGCGECADQCPYGSIQMHPIGVIPAVMHGWRFAPAPVDGAWTHPDFPDAAWAVDATPLVDDASLEKQLSGLPGYQPRCAVALRFRIAADHFQKDATHQLTVVTTAGPELVRVWLNGTELHTTERPRQVKREDFGFAGGTRGVTFALEPAQLFLRPGRNTVAVRVPRPPQAAGQRWFTLRLVAERESDDPMAEIAVVGRQAVVCDQCSHLPTGAACVTACPHDAALRVNASLVTAR
jgi:Fe-S-cluster-containing hydrogenase component 2/CRP-like cAMP-binding protein